jgi:hypothetical protein
LQVTDRFVDIAQKFVDIGTLWRFLERLLNQPASRQKIPPHPLNIGLR